LIFKEIKSEMKKEGLNTDNEKDYKDYLVKKYELKI